jgi:ribonuclease E
MDSAERRTEEENTPADSAEPTPISDADVFFPGSDTNPAAEPENVKEERPVELEPEISEETWTDSYSPEPVAETVHEPQESLAPPPEPSDEEAYGTFADDFAEEHPRPNRRHPRGDRQRGRGGRRSFSRPGFGRPKPLIQDIFKRGQEVLVQVIKEGIGTKGPTLSTYISIAGRYLVLMPGLNRIGVSRKIADEDQRHRLRDVLSELQPPKGLGFIIRTAGLDRTKKELQRDLAYLSRLWQVVVRRIRKLKSPEVIYKESDMITRTIRDTFSSEIDTIWVDEPKHFEQAHEFLQMIMPRYSNRIRQYSDSEPLFHKYGIEEEIARIQLRHVPLPNGGSIVIDQTEALVAIDVNSGNFRADNNAEETAYQMNLLAAKEIARQLRLRDLGGVIVNDFIDMREENHRRGVERALREAIKRDRARTKILKISAFGIIEMTRQRIRPSLKRSVYQDCPHCLGTGQVKTCESMSIDVMRMLQLAAHHKNVSSIQVKVAEEVAHYLHNKKRKEVGRLEEEGSLQVTISGAVSVSPEHLEYVCYDNNNNEIKLYPGEDSKNRRR